MSKDLVDVDDFTSPIHVPEGSDSRNNAAGDVELIAQRLANRTFNLLTSHNALDADAARKSQVNTFTQGQVINVDNAEPFVPLITTTQKMSDWAPKPDNRWKLVMAFPTQGDALASIYVGQFPDGAALVNNARWDVWEEEWVQLDPAYPSTAMIGRSGQYGVSFRPMGAAPWAEWPIDNGGDFIAGGNVGAHFEFVYHPVQSHWVQLFPEGGFNNGMNRMTLNAGEAAYYRIRAPSGAVIGQVNVKLQEYLNCQYDINLVRTHGFNSSDATVPTSTVVATHHVNPGGAGVVVNKVLLFGGLTVSNEFDHYWVHVLCIGGAGGSPSPVDVWGVQLGFTDPGPRNH